MHVEDSTAHAQPSLPCPGEALGYTPWLGSLDPGSCAGGTPCYAFCHGDLSVLHILCKTYFSVTDMFLNSIADVPYFLKRSFKTSFIVQQAMGTAFQVHLKQTLIQTEASQKLIKPSQD